LDSELLSYAHYKKIIFSDWELTDELMNELTDELTNELTYELKEGLFAFYNDNNWQNLK